MKIKIPSAKQTAPFKRVSGAYDLLKIADHLRLQAKKAENIISWREKTIALRGQADTGSLDPSLALLKMAQVQRDAEVMDTDEALYLIDFIVDDLAEDAINTDSTLTDLSAKIDAVEKREGLADDEYWLVDDPGVPADWKALNNQYDRRLREIRAAVMRQYDEDEVADIYLNAPDVFKRRSKAGHRLSLKNDPAKLAEVEELDKLMDNPDREARLKGLERLSAALETTPPT